MSRTDMTSVPPPARPSRSERTPLIYGEALFDRFPDGRRVLGGAPFNVAWHLQGFGRAPLVISRIGRDESGQEINARMAAWGMTRHGLQIDESHPTGRVTVTLVHDEPAFEIESDQAYDFIAREQACTAVDDTEIGIMYHGTLALRSDASWEALRALFTQLQVPAMCDVNLRAPWWSADRVTWSLRAASYVKLNERELAILTEQPTTSLAQCEAAANMLAATHGIETVIVTRGAEGAMLLRSGEPPCWEEASPVEHFVDSVGAGDAFSAIAMIGLLEQWEPAALMRRALRFAAEICTIPGATTSDVALYRRHRISWESHATT